MVGAMLKERRRQAGWTQKQAARRLGVTQAYLSMLERGKRNLPQHLARAVLRCYRLPPTVLPLPHTLALRTAMLAGDLAKELAALGYPGFAHLRPGKKKNPAEVLVTALAQSNLESRVAEALPWLVFRYPDLDWEWLTRVAKAHDLQNRLGFVTTLGRRLAEDFQQPVAQRLAQTEVELEWSRLEREDTFCQESLTPAERSWLQGNRPADAVRWHLLTDLSPRYFPHAAPRT